MLSCYATVVLEWRQPSRPWPSAPAPPPKTEVAMRNLWNASVPFQCALFRGASLWKVPHSSLVKESLCEDSGQMGGGGWRLTFSLHAHNPMARNATPRNCWRKKRETDEWVTWLRHVVGAQILRRWTHPERRSVKQTKKEARLHAHLCGTCACKRASFFFFSEGLVVTVVRSVNYFWVARALTAGFPRSK